MSRWSKDFDQSPFLKSWKIFIEKLSHTKVDDLTIVTAVDEMNRLKMVAAYIDEIIQTIDPDFVPPAVWVNSYPQAQGASDQLLAYESDRNVVRLSHVNDSMDNILSYIKPYHVLPPKILRPLRASVKAMKSETDLFISDLRSEGIDIIEYLREIRLQGEKSIEKIKESYEKMNSLENDIFVGREGYLSIEEAIQTARRITEKQKSEIDEFYSKLLAEPDSLKFKLDRFEGEIELKEEALNKLFQSNKDKSDKLSEFYLKIYGEKNQDGSVETAGLEDELKSRLDQLGKIESQQKIKYDSLFQKIESLLPGANSAGLASAYGNLSEKFTDPIKTYTIVFYISLALLLIVAFLTSADSVGIYPKAFINFVKPTDWNIALRSLLNKLPFVAPLVWLAMFSSSRRSQYERLQQEYSHKEALARSYESYKKELNDLDGDSQEMLKALINKAIETIAYNASTTLDGKHVEPSPATKMLDTIKKEDIEKVFEKLIDLVEKAKKL